MAYKKYSGILQGKFTQKYNDKLYKFVTSSQICYITFKFPSEPVMNCVTAITAKEAGKLFGRNHYKFGKYHNAAAIARRQEFNSKRRKAITEENAIKLEENNVAFGSAKLGAGYRAVTPNRKYGGKEKNAIFRHTRTLSKLLVKSQEQLQTERVQRLEQAAWAAEAKEQAAQKLRAAEEAVKEVFQGKKLRKEMKAKYHLGAREIDNLILEWADIEEKEEWGNNFANYLASIFNINKRRVEDGRQIQQKQD